MNISKWMRINKLSINPQKTEYMIIGHPRRTNKILSHEPLMLNGAEIKHVKETKPLGIIVDEGLNWNEQYRKVKGKVSGGLWSLKKLMKIAPQSQLVNIYQLLSILHPGNLLKNNKPNCWYKHPKYVTLECVLSPDLTFNVYHSYPYPFKKLWLVYVRSICSSIECRLRKRPSTR